MTSPASAITHLIDALLWFMPPEKRRKWRRGILIGCGVAFLAAGGIYGVQWIGPYADGPPVDPFERRRARAKSFEQNAAEVYAETIRLRTPPPREDWRTQVDRCDTPLDPDLATWIDENAASLNLTREAAGVGDCCFDLKRRDNGQPDLYEIRLLRAQIKFVALSARLAAERRDIDALADAVETLSGISRHMATFPGIVGNLMCAATSGYVYLFYPSPYEWDGVSPEALDAYRARLAGALAAQPDLNKALLEERDEFSWYYRQAGVSQSAYYLPYRRFNAEIDRVLQPYLALAEQPPRVWADRDHALWREVREAQSWPPFRPMGWANMPRCAARDSTKFTRVFELQLRTATFRRGTLVLDAVIGYERRRGGWPGSLDELECESVIDPYSGEAFVYRPTDAGFTLYSVGVDGDDDGGVHDHAFGEKKLYGDRPQPPPDGDFVFWPLPRGDFD